MDVTQVIQLANKLLTHAGISKEVKTTKQCNSVLFTQLYEALTGSRVPGVVLQAPTSEAVKCQAVVDALSTHLSPHVTLEHIQGPDLAAHDTMALKNLLDIFSVLFHLPAADGGGESSYGELSEADDSNIISTKGFSVISEVIQEELGPSTSHTTDSTAELLRPVPRARLPWERERPRLADSSSTTAGPPSTLHTSSSYSEVSRNVNTLNPKDDATLTSSNTDPGDPTVTAKPKPSIVVPSGSSTEPSHSPSKSPSPPLHTPPLSPLHQHQLLSSPLHHSTPHVTTRSRVFRDKAPGDRQHPQLSTPNLPAIEEYYTELTHPPRLERAGHPTRAHLHPAQLVAHSAPEVLGKPQEKEKSKGDIRIKPTSRGTRGTSDHSPVLRPPPSAERRAVDQSSGGPARVSTAVQTDTPPPEMHECPSAQGTSKDREEQSQTYSPLPETSATITPSFSSSVAQTTLPPRVHLSASTEQQEHPRSLVFTADQTSSRGVGDLTSVQRQLELDSRAAQTRASVLATLYQNYLRELKSSKPTGTPTHKIKHPKPSKYYQRHRRATPHSKPARKPASPPPSGTRREEEQHTATESSGEESAADREKREVTPTEFAPADPLLPLVEREFPFVHVSPSTMHRLWQKQLQQITALTRPPQHKTSHVKKVAEMERRQKALLCVIRKELDHTRILQMQQEQRHQQQAVKASILTKRRAAARARQYYNEYELRLKAKLQKRRTREEQIFRQAFEDGLDIQRERIRELQRYAKEKQQKQARQHHEQLESMENYYRDQFALLAEAAAKEREEVTVREKAQYQMAQQLRRELQQQTEREIQALQESLDREEEVAHFRQLDAQNLRHKLNCMTFTTSVK